jgi:hypothetical protein
MGNAGVRQTFRHSGAADRAETPLLAGAALIAPVTSVDRVCL